MASTRMFVQSASQTSLSVMIAALNDRAARGTHRLEVAGRDISVPRNWRDIHTDHGTLSINKFAVTDLEPGKRYELELSSGTNVIDGAAGTTLPAGSSDGFALMVGSCHSIDSTAKHVLEDAYGRVAAELDGPTYNIWCGDQVYLDAPWQKGWKIEDTHRVVYDKYHRCWGLTAERSGLAGVMAQTSNWYLPDDHEFWNGFPHPSILTLPIHTLRRVVVQAWRARPRGPVPHPKAQGKFGRVAGEAYCTFQTTDQFESFSENVSPPQVQLLELDAATVVLADTRWHRTIKKSGDQAGFMKPEDLKQVIDILDTTEQLVCLVLAKPLIGHLPHRGVTRGKVEYGPEDYTHQYERLWQAITRRAQRGEATLTVGGDVHKHAVRTAIDGALIEVVSSPMALLPALKEGGVISRARNLWKAAKAKVRSFEANRRDGMVDAEQANDAEPLFPDFRGEGEWVEAIGSLESAQVNPGSGIAGIDFDLSDALHPAFVFHGAVEDGGSGIRLETLRFQWDGAAWTKGASVIDTTVTDVRSGLRAVS